MFVDEESLLLLLATNKGFLLSSGFGVDCGLRTLRCSVVRSHNIREFLETTNGETDKNATHTKSKMPTSLLMDTDYVSVLSE